MALIDKYLKEYQDSHNGYMPKYLWQLRLDDRQYNELREYIKQHSSDSNFALVEQELVLYISEWWRREYNEGKHAYESIWESLGYRFNKETGEDKPFMEAFKSGRKSLCESLTLQIIKTSGQERVLDSMLYQGGLPMNYIIKNISNNVGWGRFFKNLAWNGQDFSFLTDGDDGDTRKTLALSNSIHKFCDDLQNAIDHDKIDSLPFQFNEGWWKAIKKEIDEGRQERKARNPFSLVWRVCLDEPAKNFNLTFRIEGPRVLSSVFIKEELTSFIKEERTSVSISIRINDKVYPFAEYLKNGADFFSRRNVSIEIPYNEGDMVSLYLEDTGEILWNRQLVFSEPKLFSLNDDQNNFYEFCNPAALSSTKCMVLATTEWNCSECQGDEYAEERTGATYKVFSFTPPTSQITLKSSGSSREIVLAPDSSTISAEIDSKCALRLGVTVQEQIFNADKVEFILHLEDKNENIGGKDKRINLDRNINGIQLGLIRATINDNGLSDTVRFINVGNLEIKCQESTSETCKICISWPYGVITSNDANEENQLWVIEKDTLGSKRCAEFIFSPKFGKPFTLHIIPQFYDFCIYNRNGGKIGSDAIIPIVDLNSYRYYLNLKENLLLYPDSRKTKCDDMKYTYFKPVSSSQENKSNSLSQENTVRRRYFRNPYGEPSESKVPVEGSLSSLFMNGSELVYSQLEQSMESLPKSKVVMKIGECEYTFQDFPYRLSFEFDKGIISVVENNKLPKYDGKLLAIPLAEPDGKPIMIPKDNQGQYDLTKVKNDNPDIPTPWIVYGDLRGCILPLMVDPNKEINDSEREEKRSEFLENVSSKLKNAKCFDETWMRAISWFNVLPNGQIPGTSILELVAISEDRALLWKFALQYALLSGINADNSDTLQSTFLDFQHQMSFIWEWSEDIDVDKAFDFVKTCPEIEQRIKSQYYNWAIQNSNVYAYIKNISSHIDDFLKDFIKQFKGWYQILKNKSVPEKVLQDPDVNAYKKTGYEGVSEKAQNAFKSFRQPDCNDVINNDQWIEERIQFNEELKKQNLSDYLNEKGIKHDEEIRIIIRKSILYGLKFKKQDEI